MENITILLYLLLIHRAIFGSSLASVWVAFLVHILAQYENSYWTGFWNYLASGMLEIRIVSSLEMMNGVYDIFA